MKTTTPMGRLRDAKRAKGWVPYEAWVHKSNYAELVVTVKVLQIPADADRAEMDTATLYSSLTPEQRWFERALSAYPQFYQFWNFNTHECDIQRLNAAMGPMSPSEQAMARFFLSVWLHDDSQGVGVINAAELEDKNRKVIADWLAAPYFP